MIQTPPPPTPADIRRIKALTRAVATDVRRHGTPALDQKGMAWMEDHPQCLWPLFDTAVAASTADQRDEALTVACRWLLANQLELIRYRLERGHDWARSTSRCLPRKADRADPNQHDATGRLVRVGQTAQACQGTDQPRDRYGALAAFGGFRTASQTRTRFIAAVPLTDQN